MSRPTVFAVGNKAQLLALARRAAIGGESAMGNEPEFARILATLDATELLHQFAVLASGIACRRAPLHAVLEDAAAADPSPGRAPAGQPRRHVRVRGAWLPRCARWAHCAPTLSQMGPRMCWGC